ncbi:MAG: hypothetical protein V4482_06130 [Pseudomonadota bacterium]
MKKIWPTHFTNFIISGIVLGASSEIGFTKTEEVVTEVTSATQATPTSTKDASKSSVKSSATAKSEATAKAKPESKDATKATPKPKKIEPVDSVESESDNVETEKKTANPSADADASAEQGSAEMEAEIEGEIEKEHLKSEAVEKAESTMASVADSSGTTAAPAVPVTDKPATSVIKETEIDAHAKSMLEIADNHRNHRTQFSALESWKEAIRLYQEVAATQIAISPDLKARAIINLVEMTVWSPLGDTTLEKRLEAFHRIVEVTQNTSYSADVKGWAKRHLAKLYLVGGFDLEPVQAKRQALALLEEVIADSTVLAETKARAMIQLAYHYVSLAFDVSDKDALQQATKLLKAVFEDKAVREPLRVDAKFLLASIENPYDDSINEKRLALLREIIADSNISSVEKAKVKERLAHYYLARTFDVSIDEAHAQAHTLLKELAADTSLGAQDRINHYIQLAEHYIHVKLDLKPTESRAEALKMYNDLPSKIQLNALQSYVYQKELAHYCVINAFHEDPIVSKQIATKIYKSLMNDTTLTIQQRAEIYWIVANLYIMKQLDPQGGVDGKSEGLTLIKFIINDPKVGFETINQFKLNLAILFQNNAFSMLPSKARSEAASLLMELLSDNRISAIDKQQIQARLDVLNKMM